MSNVHVSTMMTLPSAMGRHLRMYYVLYVKAISVLCIAGFLLAMITDLNSNMASLRSIKKIVQQSSSSFFQLTQPHRSSESSDSSSKDEDLCTGPGCGKNATEDLELYVFVPHSVPDHPPFQQNLESNKITRLWKDDPICNHLVVRLGKNIPQMYLVSYPWSGNTYARYLVESATGIFTGSIYKDKEIEKLGYQGEMVDHKDGSVLLIKSHESGPRTKDEPRPVVLIIRNPRDLFSLLPSFAPTGEKDEYKVLHQQLKIKAEAWERLASIMLFKSKYCHVVLYENMIANPIIEVRKILKFMKVPEDKERLQCLARHLQQKGEEVQSKKDPYTAEEKSFLKEAVKRVSLLVKERTFHALPYGD